MEITSDHVARGVRILQCLAAPSDGRLLKDPEELLLAAQYRLDRLLSEKRELQRALEEIEGLMAGDIVELAVLLGAVSAQFRAMAFASTHRQKEEIGRAGIAWLETMREQLLRELRGNAILGGVQRGLRGALHRALRAPEGPARREQEFHQLRSELEAARRQLDDACQELAARNTATGSDGLKEVPF